MAACSFIKPSGERCRAQPMRGEQWCYVHHPELADRRQAASRKGGHRGGRGRGTGEISGIKAQLQDLVTDVLAGDLETGRAAVANQLVNTRLRTIEQERKNKETEELEARIEALERGADRWRGA